MNKKVKIGIIIFSIFLILLIISSLIKKFSENKVVNYIESIGFVQDDSSSLFFKQISDLSFEDYNNKKNNDINASYEMLYFNTYTYQLTKDKLEYSNKITKSFNPTYDYINDSLIYTYRINLNDTNIIIDGEYSAEDDNFTCNIVFSYNIDIDSAFKDICEKIKYDVKDFNYEAITLIKKASIIDIIKSKQ